MGVAMKAKLTASFTCYYCGEKLTFKAGDIAEGWPASRALAKGVATPYNSPKKEESRYASEDHES